VNGGFSRFFSALADTRFYRGFGKKEAQNVVLLW
jgi:hypothetical protein